MDGSGNFLLACSNVGRLGKDVDIRCCRVDRDACCMLTCVFVAQYSDQQIQKVYSSNSQFKLKLRYTLLKVSVIPRVIQLPDA